MLQVVVVPSLALPLLLPLLLQNVLDAVLGRSGFVGNGAVVGLGLVGQPFEQGALVAASPIRIDQQGLSFEALGSAVQIVANCVHLLLVYQKHYLVQILPGFDVVQSAHDDRKLRVEAVGQVLNFVLIGGDLHPWTSFPDEFGHHVSFVEPDVFLSEHELPIEVGIVDCVHVHQVHVPHST